VNTSPPKVLTYLECSNILSKYAIPLARADAATSSEEAVKIATRIGYPVALKILASEIVHKTEADAIRLHIRTESELISGYHEIIRNAKKYCPKVRIEGVLVQEMVQRGTEVIVGVSRDPLFGLTIMFGIGGILVEILRDVSLRVLPITRDDAHDMIQEIKGYNVLQGFRGRPKADVDAITDILLKISRLSVDFKGSLVEMDINPLIVLNEGQGAKAVDLRLVLDREDDPESGGRR
jgi:acetyltransferase